LTIETGKEGPVAVKAGDWKTIAFGEVSPIPYDEIFSREQFDRLELGLRPREMEDKWFVYFEDNYLFFHRSWTGQPVYRVRFVSQDESYRVEEAVVSQDVLSRSNPAYEVQVLGFLIGALLLGEQRRFPVPASVQQRMPGMYQHHIVGRGFPEVVTPADGALPPVTKTRDRSAPSKTPWWKIWR
jgi:hypothetical protein